MIILDIKNNTQYDLSSVNGTFLTVEFGDTTITSYTEWDAVATAPLHKGNYQTWEQAEIKVLIKGSNRTTLEKRISYFKYLLNYADVYFTEMGFDFHFRGELTDCSVEYYIHDAVVTATMKGRKLSTAQEIVFDTSTQTSGTARVNWMGNAKVPLRIDMYIDANKYGPIALNISSLSSSGTALWSEVLNFDSWYASAGASVVTLDGVNGVMYSTVTATSARENWVENYNSNFLPYVEPVGDIIRISLTGGTSTYNGASKVKLTFEGRWV